MADWSPIHLGDDPRMPVIFGIPQRWMGDLTKKNPTTKQTQTGDPWF